MPPVQLRPGISICLTTTDPFLPIIAWTCNDDNCSWSSQLVPSILPGQSFLFICLSLAVRLCLKKCSENRVLVVLLQIGAKDLTVYNKVWFSLSTWKEKGIKLFDKVFFVGHKGQIYLKLPFSSLYMTLTWPARIVLMMVFERYLTDPV